MIVVNVKTTAEIMVKRSKFFSASVDPAMDPPIEPPPNRSERPPPLPAWSKTKMTINAAARMCTEINMMSNMIIILVSFEQTKGILLDFTQFI